jgi:hypothetical protein
MSAGTPDPQQDWAWRIQIQAAVDDAQNAAIEASQRAAVLAALWRDYQAWRAKQ